MIRLTLKMTDRDVVEHFRSVVKRGYLSEAVYYRKRGLKPQWVWRTRNLREVEEVINLLYPYMGERRKSRMDEARVALEAKRERRRELGRVQLGGKRKVVHRDNKGRYA